MEEENEVEERLPSCKQADCPIRDSGKCLEGLEPENCSHFYWSDADSEDDEDGKQSSENDVGPVIQLYSGEELKIADLGLVTNQYNTNLVIIIGESYSGKSTILTSIFDLFQVGKFKRYYFAGSMTQYGFETRCHLSRAPSGLAEPDTDHTISKEFNFLHIAYKDVDDLEGKACHLLLSDISGERFKMANNSANMMSDMTLVKEADHIIYLLDGEKLANKLERTAIITRAGQFITRALDNSIFGNDTKLMIIFTKGDILRDMIADGGLDRIKKQFTEKFADKLKALSFEVIAARPKPPTVEIPFGYGLENLLTLWKQRELIAMPSISPAPVSERYFDNYKQQNV